MPAASRFAVFARAGLLPLLLAAAVVLGLGSYTETSDDQTLAWLFSGVLGSKPVPSLPLYFHGYGHGLAAAYTAWPLVPWLGLLLGALLALATGLTFAVLDRLLRPHLPPLALVLALGGFFAVAWLEHWLWFSHVRVAVLLAGSGVLFAAQRPARRGALLLGGAAVLAAWLIRPGMAMVAVAAVVPAARLLAGTWRRAAPVLLLAASTLMGATLVAAAPRPPAEIRAQARDAAFARILDFDQLQPQPRTAADSLGTAAVGLWLLGDSTTVNETLVQRAYRFDAAIFLGHTVPAKLRLRTGLLVRDYFPLLLALAATAVAVRRQRQQQRWFWLVQLGFVGGLVVLAGGFKLPPRLALPLLDFWVLTNGAFCLPARGVADVAWRPGPASWVSRVGWAGAVLAILGAYGLKTWHRHEVLSHERHRHESALSYLRHKGGRPVRILAGANDFLKSLSPFQTYRIGPGPVLLLTGWPAHDASQARLRQALTGTRDQTECLRRLVSRSVYSSPPEAVWLLTPETAGWLSRRFRFDGLPLVLGPLGGPLPGEPAPEARIYYLQGWPTH